MITFLVTAWIIGQAAFHLFRDEDRDEVVFRACVEPGRM